MTPEPTPEPMSVLTFNIGNPSRERAERQLAWLAERPEHVLVLTETADSKGCAFLAERFTAAGYGVTFPAPESGERGVMIVSRLPSTDATPVKVGYLPCRAVSASVQTAGGPLEVIGLYIPSRDATAAKTDRKRRFLEECRAAIPPADAATARVVIGDFNILEPDHQPRYPFFRPFEYDFYRWLGEAGYRDAFRLRHPAATEYSWVGRTGDGYRYDHAFVSGALEGEVGGCAYVHETRTQTRLTDHSGLSLQLSLLGAPRLLISNPTAAPEPDTLF
jgi:exodeoxyribonuclease III